MRVDLQRAQFFLDTQRYKEAQDELGKVLASDPENAKATAMLAFCLHRQKKSKEAKKIAQQAIFLDPGSTYALNIAGHICVEQGDQKSAEKALRESLRLFPNGSYAYGLLALSLGVQAKWNESLEAAERGLKLNPNETNCHNARVKALSVLGRSAEAHQAIYESMSENSEEPLAQCASGWAMLRVGKVKEATEHFGEALRLDPNLEDARRGMIEALRARFPLYRAVIACRTWLIRLPPGVRSGVTLGLYVVARVSLSLSNNPILMTLGGLYLAFVFFAWFGGPLLNITLMMHPLGRMALRRNERMEATALGVAVATGLLSAVIALVANRPSILGWTAGAGLCFLLAILFSLINSLRRKSVIVCMFAYAAALISLIGIVFGFV